MLYTIATAGHIDHGKSSLVRALTGMDPDRLPEEKSREMTIELGFAWFELPDKSEVAIVDVPGHERFVDAMITGVGSIDMVMFIVAADDGWMPQSQEHLEILDHLGTERGIVVVTKTDLAAEEWVELVKEDIADKVRGTFLEGTPITAFSAASNSGLDEILKSITEKLAGISVRDHPDRPRLYVDRVFSMTGHGAVVTGTMRDGVFAVGDDVRVIPHDLSGKIKSIQTHKKVRDRSQAGSRVALNISGISHNELSRGSVIVGAGQYSGTKSFAARIRMSPHAQVKLTHNRTVKILIGTVKANARAFVFAGDTFDPGSEGVCEFHLDSPILARVGDRFIVRLPTPDVLLGGGVVIDTDYERHPRSDKTARKHYETRHTDSVDGLIESDLRRHKGIRIDKLLESSNFSRKDIESAIEMLIKDGKIVRLGQTVFDAGHLSRASERLMEKVSKFEEKHPARRGIPKSELISVAGQDATVPEAALSLLIEQQQLAASGALVHSPGFAPKLKPEQERLRGDIVAMFTSDEYNPPSRKQLERISFAMRDIVNFMLDGGELVELSGGLLLLGKDFEVIRARIVETIESKGKIDVAGIREQLGFSRKYGVPILEKLDSMGVTRRVGDHRVLAND